MFWKLTSNLSLYWKPISKKKPQAPARTNDILRIVWRQKNNVSSGLSAYASLEIDNKNDDSHVPTKQGPKLGNCVCKKKSWDDISRQM